jgi:hypothetical protein
MEGDEVVEVYLATDSPQAHFVRNLLVDAGIDARVVGGTVSSSLGLPQGIESAPAVLVHKADEARARALVDDFEKRNLQPHSDDEPRQAWKCPSCGELVDADFELCWNCQNPRTPY